MQWASHHHFPFKLIFDFRHHKYKFSLKSWAKISISIVIQRASFFMVFPLNFYDIHKHSWWKFRFCFLFFSSLRSFGSPKNIYPHLWVRLSFFFVFCSDGMNWEKSKRERDLPKLICLFMSTVYINNDFSSCGLCSCLFF